MATKRYCSFCGKKHSEVFYLVEGPGACICDECVILTADIVQAARARVAVAEAMQDAAKGWPERRQSILEGARQPEAQAGEIERLRAEIEDWRGRLATQCGETLAARHKATTARREGAEAMREIDRPVIEAVRVVLSQSSGMQQAIERRNALAKALAAHDRSLPTDTDASGA